MKITKCFAKQVYKDHATNVLVYLPSSKTKNENYDKFRDVGYNITEQNYLTVKAIIRDAKPEELIVKSIGLVATGAKKIVIKDSDVTLIKLSTRVVISGIDYYVYDDAVGNKMQILGSQFGFSTVLLFKKEV